jgi:hypothetical protein
LFPALELSTLGCSSTYNNTLQVLQKTTIGSAPLNSGRWLHGYTYVCIMQHQYILVKYNLKNRVLWRSTGNTFTFSSLGTNICWCCMIHTYVYPCSQRPELRGADPIVVFCKTCSVLLYVLEQPRVDNSSAGNKLA